MLKTLVVLLAATTVAVPISRRLGFGSILGYLLAGILIGPSGLGLVTDVSQITNISELGVVMLLFLIGLELRPHRVWILRNVILGLGLGQMVPTAVLLAVLAHLAGVSWPDAAVLGAGLALSSTAIVLPMFAERDLLPTTSGRDGFAVLLFQDVVFVPMVALVPLLAGGQSPPPVAWLDVLRGVAAIAAILAGGYFLIRPIFRAVGGAHTGEVFTATALLIVLGTAALASWVGLSMSLGAFIAGVMLSESEYRHELEADIKPFQGLLLGFFFISVGMGADLAETMRHSRLVSGAVLALIAVKALVAFGVGLVKRRDAASALRFAFALAQGSEFSFVLFAVAVAGGALGAKEAGLATNVVALSMVIAPVLFAGAERFLLPRIRPRKEAPAYDAIDLPTAPVIICGFGRMGQIVGRVLRMRRVPFIALDKSPAQVEVVRRFGGKVHFGNPAREELLRAAGGETASLLVIALDGVDEGLQVVDMVRRHFPHLVIFARAHDRRHAHLLMDRGVTHIVRETFHSSLKLVAELMEALGIPPAEIERDLCLFREHDERHLAETHAIYLDEQQLIQSTQQAARELAELFEADELRSEVQQPERSTG